MPFTLIHNSWRCVCTTSSSSSTTSHRRSPSSSNFNSSNSSYSRLNCLFFSLKPLFRLLLGFILFQLTFDFFFNINFAFLFIIIIIIILGIFFFQIWSLSNKCINLVFACILWYFYDEIYEFVKINCIISIWDFIIAGHNIGITWLEFIFNLVVFESSLAYIGTVYFVTFIEKPLIYWFYYEYTIIRKFSCFWDFFTK